LSLFSSKWRDHKATIVSNSCNTAVPKAPDLLLDLSLIPVPLALPPLRLPREPASLSNDTIAAVKWWPDNSFGGPPLLVAITVSTTLLAYKIPPPNFALEPTKPSFDTLNAQSSVASVSCHDGRDANSVDSGSDSDESCVADKNTKSMLSLILILVFVFVLNHLWMDYQRLQVHLRRIL
jgi:hypothetical protein